ncbi:hypothetical protein KI387_021230, partial [Taxus chinensis]
MNSCVFLQDLTASDVGLFEGVSAVKSLKILSLTTSPEFADLPFLTLLGSFPDLEELKLTATFIQDMAVDKILSTKDGSGNRKGVITLDLSKSQTSICRNITRDGSTR